MNRRRVSGRFPGLRSQTLLVLPSQDQTVSVAEGDEKLTDYSCGGSRGFRRVPVGRVITAFPFPSRRHRPEAPNTRQGLA